MKELPSTARVIKEKIINAGVGIAYPVLFKALDIYIWGMTHRPNFGHKFHNGGESGRKHGN